MKCVVFVNIKVCDIIFEKVKEDIVSWCYNKNVNVFSIFFLVNYFVWWYLIFVICVNIDEKDYNKILEFDFWLDIILVRDWIVRNEIMNR